MHMHMYSGITLLITYKWRTEHQGQGITQHHRRPCPKKCHEAHATAQEPLHQPKEGGDVVSHAIIREAEAYRALEEPGYEEERREEALKLFFLFCAEKDLSIFSYTVSSPFLNR